MPKGREKEWILENLLLNTSFALHFFWSGIPVALKSNQGGQKDSLFTLSVPEEHPLNPHPWGLLAFTELEQANCQSAYFPNTFPAKKQQLVNSIHCGKSIFFCHYYHHLVTKGNTTPLLVYERLKLGHLEICTSERIWCNSLWKQKLILLHKYISQCC